MSRLSYACKKSIVPKLKDALENLGRLLEIILGLHQCLILAASFEIFSEDTPEISFFGDCHPGDNEFNISFIS